MKIQATMIIIDDKLMLVFICIDDVVLNKTDSATFMQSGQTGYELQATQDKL